MRAPTSLQITPSSVLPGDHAEMKLLKQKLNEVIGQLDEAYYRELPPHASMNFASWKWYENPSTGDLELWHRSGDTWSKTHWDITGNLTRRPSP